MVLKDTDLEIYYEVQLQAPLDRDEFVWDPARIVFSNNVPQWWIDLQQQWPNPKDLKKYLRQEYGCGHTNHTTPFKFSDIETDKSVDGLIKRHYLSFKDKNEKLRFIMERT